MIEKTVTVDGHEYHVKFERNGNFIFPKAFNLTVSYNGNVLRSGYQQNPYHYSYKEAVERIVKDTHKSIVSKQLRESYLSELENELDEWDGVIEI